MVIQNKIIPELGNAGLFSIHGVSATGISDTLFVSAFSSNNIACSKFSLAGYGMSLKQKKVISGGSCSISANERNSVVNNTGTVIGYVNVPSQVTFKPSGEETIYYMSWE